MSQQEKLTINLFDKLAILLSSICLIHCLILPFVIILLPFLGFLSHDEWVHKALISCAIPITSFALFRSGNWRNKTILFPAILGISMLFCGAFIDQVHEYETILSVCGALFLAYAHFRNSKIVHSKN